MSEGYVAPLEVAMDKERRRILKAKVIPWEGSEFGIHYEYDDGTSGGAQIGTLEDAHMAAQEAVERGEEFIRELMEASGADPDEPNEKIQIQ